MVKGPEGLAPSEGCGEAAGLCLSASFWGSADLLLDLFTWMNDSDSIPHGLLTVLVNQIFSFPKDNRHPGFNLASTALT